MSAIETNYAVVHNAASVAPTFAGDWSPTLTFSFTFGDEGYKETQTVQVGVVAAILLWQALTETLAPVAEIFEGGDLLDVSPLFLGDDE